MKHYLERLASCDRSLRPALVRLPGDLPIRLYSEGRRRVLTAYSRRPPRPRAVPAGLARTLWGLTFRSPVLNAAGVFKKGEGYAVVAAQGAGAYLAGTTTATPRRGNDKAGIHQPFAPYPKSGAASNWLGLPNPGHGKVADRLSWQERVDGCPVGASLGADPGVEPAEALDGLITGLHAYADAGVDFLEINESCPNTEAEASSFDALVDRLRSLSERFLEGRDRRLPVVLKLSTDTDVARLPEVLDLLVELGFDGLTVGNTSTDYAGLRSQIAPGERRLFDRFTERFGGGVSGRPLAPRSLALTRAASEHLRRHHPDSEFHVIRVGGVESAADVAESLEAGAALVQWYTGYFEAFGRDGHRLYTRLYREMP
ncbi:MAG: hypothetical protein AAGF23_08545 [Acidobacteriota bacterium]